LTCQSITVFRSTLTIRALVMGDGVLCYGALEIVGLLFISFFIIRGGRKIGLLKTNNLVLESVTEDDSKE